MGAGAVAASSLGAGMFANSRRLAALQGLGVMCFGLPLIVSGALPYTPVVLGLMCVVGLGNALVDTGLHTLPARLVPEHLLARVFGVKASLAGLSVAVGAFVTPSPSHSSASVAPWPCWAPRPCGRGACLVAFARNRRGDRAA